MVYNMQVIPTETNFNPTNNTSKVKVSIYLGGYTGTVRSGDVEYKLPGSSTWTSGGSLVGKTVSTTALSELHSFTINSVTHDSDGGGILTVRITLFSIGTSAYQGSFYTDIALQNLNSDLSTLHYQYNTIEDNLYSVAVGTPSLASISKPVSSARLVLKQTIGSDVTVLMDTDNSTTYTFNYDTSLCNPAIYGADVARNTSMPIALILETYDQGRFLGANYYTINVAYPLENPVTSNVVTNFDYVTDGIDANFLAAERASGLYFQGGLTQFEFSCTVTPQNYAYIESAEIRYNTGYITVRDTVYEDRTGENPGAVSISGSSVIQGKIEGDPAYIACDVVIRDSRGKIAYLYSDTIGQAYIQAPTIQNAAIQRGTYSGGTWTQDEDAGTAIRFTGTLDSQSNSAVITITKNGTVFSSNTYNAGSITIYITNCPPSSNTELLVEVNNYLSQSSYQFVAPPTKPDINYNSDIHGVAFGQLAEVSKGVTIAPDWALFNNGTGMVFGNQSSLPSVPSGESWGRWIGFTKATDKYYLYLSSNQNLYLGTDLNGAGTITWSKIGGGGVDLVTSHGVTNSWYWRKWESGLFEMDGAFRVSPTSPSVWGNGYYSEAFTINLPFASYATWITGNGATNVCYVCNASVTSGTSVLSFRIAAPHTLPEGDYDVHLHVTGLWKQSYT